MDIGALTPLNELVAKTKGIYLSTAADAVAISRVIESQPAGEFTLLIGA